MKKPDDEVMAENCNAIVILAIFGQFGAIRKPELRLIVGNVKVKNLFMFMFVFMCALFGFGVV